MSRSITSVAVICLGLAVAVGTTAARQPQRATSAKPVALRGALPHTAATPRAAPRAAQPTGEAASDGDRFRYDSCGCSGG